MYALVEIKGKQYKAEKGALLKVDHIQEEVGTKVEFESVLLVSNDGKATFGAPYVAGAKVSGVIETEAKDKKVIVFKFKRRKNYIRRNGHRQLYSYVRVEDIIGA